MKKNYYSKTKILDQTVKKSNKSVFLLFLMFVLGLTHTYAQDEFITTWTVEADDLSITIPIFDKDKLVDGEIVENEDGITYQYDFTVCIFAWLSLSLSPKEIAGKVPLIFTS